MPVWVRRRSLACSLGARYGRITHRRGKAKALVALGKTRHKVYHAQLSSPPSATATSDRTTTASKLTPAATSAALMD